MNSRQITNYITAAAILLGITTSCSLETDELVGNGKVTNKKRFVKDFNKIDINGVFDVYLYQDVVERLEIETDDNLHKLIDVNTINGTLYIKTDTEEDYNATKMDLYLTVTDIDEITLDGINGLYCKDTLRLADLEIDKNNNGHLLLKTNLNQLDLNAYNAGEIELRGSADRVNFSNKMSGDVYAYQFVTRDMDLKHDGIGEVQINVTNNLSVDLSGVGNVRCKGIPQNVTRNISGQGKVYIQP